MDRWHERPGLPLVIAFLGGAILAGIIALIVVIIALDDDGDDDGPAQARTTGTAKATPDGTADPGTTPTPGVEPTPTPGRETTPGAALEAFIRDEFGAQHIGDCPQSVRPGRQETGVCSDQLYETDEFVTFLLGEPLSEFFGELILRRTSDGTWSVTFIDAPPPGVPITLFDDAYVYGVGDCLNFRAAPSLSAEVRSCRADGTRARVAGGPEQADGHVWWRLEGFGWGSEQFLAPVVE